jgi:hypothetical protein
VLSLDGADPVSLFFFFASIHPGIRTQGKGAAPMPAVLDNLRGQGSNRTINVGKMERWASVLGGAALAAFALRRRSKGAMGLALAGAPLIWRGATGHCSVYQKLGIDRVHGNTAGDILSSRNTLTNVSSQEPARTAEPIHGNEREYFSTMGVEPTSEGQL